MTTCISKLLRRYTGVARLGSEKTDSVINLLCLMSFLTSFSFKRAGGIKEPGIHLYSLSLYSFYSWGLKHFIIKHCIRFTVLFTMVWPLVTKSHNWDMVLVAPYEVMSPNRSNSVTQVCHNDPQHKDKRFGSMSSRNLKKTPWGKREAASLTQVLLTIRATGLGVVLQF